jgi:hypothetical protein
MVISALLAGANWLDLLSGRKFSKFAVKNIGKYGGEALNWAVDKIGKPEWKQKVSNIAKKAAEVAKDGIGSDSEITKGLENASKVLKGEHVATRRFDDGETQNALVPFEQPKMQSYLKNLGGSNFKRYTPKFKRINVKKPGKFIKKKSKHFSKTALSA